MFFSPAAWRIPKNAVATSTLPTNAENVADFIVKQVEEQSSTLSAAARAALPAYRTVLVQNLTAHQKGLTALHPKPAGVVVGTAPAPTPQTPKKLEAEKPPASAEQPKKGDAGGKSKENKDKEETPLADKGDEGTQAEVSEKASKASTESAAATADAGEPARTVDLPQPTREEQKAALAAVPVTAAEGLMQGAMSLGVPEKTAAGLSRTFFALTQQEYNKPKGWWEALLSWIGGLFGWEPPIKDEEKKMMVAMDTANKKLFMQISQTDPRMLGYTGDAKNAPQWMHDFALRLTGHELVGNPATGQVALNATELGMDGILRGATPGHAFAAATANDNLATAQAAAEQVPKIAVNIYEQEGASPTDTQLNNLTKPAARTTAQQPS
jgi:hypothetical protein